MSVSRLNILLIEDNPMDIAIARRCLASANGSLTVNVATDGHQAIDWLTKNEPPDIILLDINLGAISGKDVLAWIRETPKVHNLPVVMLTSSRARIDVIEAWDLNVADYLVKPGGFERTLDIIHRVIGLFKVSELPTKV